jgi:hypothetical protein
LCYYSEGYGTQNFVRLHDQKDQSLANLMVDKKLAVLCVVDPTHLFGEVDEIAPVFLGTSKLVSIILTLIGRKWGGALQEPRLMFLDVFSPRLMDYTSLLFKLFSVLLLVLLF